MVGGVYCLIGGETREARRWVREGRERGTYRNEKLILLTLNCEVWTMYFLMTDESSFCIEKHQQCIWRNCAQMCSPEIEISPLLALLLHNSHPRVLPDPWFVVYSPHLVCWCSLAPLVAVEALFYQSFVGQTILWIHSKKLKGERRLSVKYEEQQEIFPGEHICAQLRHIHCWCFSIQKLDSSVIRKYMVHTSQFKVSNINFSFCKCLSSTLSHSSPRVSPPIRQ